MDNQDDGTELQVSYQKLIIILIIKYEILVVTQTQCNAIYSG